MCVAVCHQMSNPCVACLNKLIHTLTLTPPASYLSWCTALCAAVNWMYAAKMGSEGAAMYDAAISLREAMLELGVAVDGGKDSLSMAAAAGVAKLRSWGWGVGKCEGRRV